MKSGKVLFFEWGAFMQKGICLAFETLNIAYDMFLYPIENWEQDEQLVNKLTEKLKAESVYDVVFSVNFVPVVSQVCETLQIRYVSWIYDCPLHIRDTSELKNSCNELYFFDRIQAEQYAAQGACHVHHLPLAADVDTFAQALQNTELQSPCDVAMLGQLYQSEYSYLCQPLDLYYRGYLEGMIQSQMKVRGAYFLEELCSEGLLHGLNNIYNKASNGTFQIQERELAYTLAKEVTGRERLMALQLLQNRCKVRLYSNDTNEKLSQVEHMGYVDYYTQMPQVFANSRINLNISLCTISLGIPLRIFDILGCGGFLITNYQPELLEHFEDGVDLVVYYDLVDLVQKVAYYLEHEEERKQIANNGYRKVQKLHTFSERIKQMKWYQDRN